MTYPVVEARSTYYSCTGAVIVPLGIAFCFGFLGGFVAASLLWSAALYFGFSNSFVIRLSLFAASVCATEAWLLTIRWVRGNVQDIEQFNAALAAGRVHTAAPLLIEHVSDNGRTVERERVPFTHDQLRAAAAILLPKRGRFDLRSMYEVFGDPGAHKFRDWLVEHPRNYANMDDRGWVTITTDGLAFLRAAQTPSPPPPEGELVPLYTSRR